MKYSGLKAASVTSGSSAGESWPIQYLAKLAAEQ
jgi:hypothetical protein